MQSPTSISSAEAAVLETLAPHVLLPILLSNSAAEPIFKVSLFGTWGDCQVSANELQHFIQWALNTSYCDRYPQHTRLQLLDLAWSAQKLLWVFYSNRQSG